jgi:hypothetical protein
MDVTGFLDSGSLLCTTAAISPVEREQTMNRKDLTLMKHKKGVTMRHFWNTYYRTIGISLALVVLTLLGLAAPASAADQVPYSATDVTVSTNRTRVPGGIIQSDVSGTGNATYLGDYTATGTALLDPHGNFTYTGCNVGANGKDSVCFALSGHVERTQDPCVVTSAGPYTVTGGTGKFANATGSGTFTSQSDTCTNTTTTTVTGTISQPNSG